MSFSAMRLLAATLATSAAGAQIRRAAVKVNMDIARKEYAARREWREAGSWKDWAANGADKTFDAVTNKCGAVHEVGKTEEDCRARIPAGGGMYYNPSYEGGWCRHIAPQCNKRVRDGYASGAWLKEDPGNGWTELRPDATGARPDATCSPMTIQGRVPDDLMGRKTPYDLMGKKWPEEWAGGMVGLAGGISAEKCYAGGEVATRDECPKKAAERIGGPYDFTYGNSECRFIKRTCSSQLREWHAHSQEVDIPRDLAMKPGSKKWSYVGGQFGGIMSGIRRYEWDPNHWRNPQGWLVKSSFPLWGEEDQFETTLSC